MIDWLTNLWLTFYYKRRKPSAVVTGGTVNPNLKPMMRFMPLKTFNHRGTVYMEGNVYNVVEGNYPLKAYVEKWYKKGKVALED